MKKYIGLFVFLGFLTLEITKVQAMIPYYPNNYINNNPVISGISGPQVLNINETGIWQVNAYDPMGSNLSYSVDWGDIALERACLDGGNCLMGTSVSSNYQQSATFNHSYSQAGVYTVTFIVTNNDGQNTKTSLSVKVRGNVINPILLLKVLSPNGGEVWFKNTTKTINWESNGRTFCNLDGPCSDSLVYDINLVNHYPICAGINCPLLFTPPVKIASGVYGNSYRWDVGKIMGQKERVRDGIYKIMICETNSGVCDFGDNYFEINSSNLSTPTITGISGPKTLKVGQTGTWQVKVKNSNEGNLSYSVDWGDTMDNVYDQINSSTIERMNKQTATFSHNYTRPGNYKIRFTVTNSNGQNVSNVYKVRIKEVNFWNTTWH